MNNLEPGADEAVYQGTERSAARAAQSTIAPGEGRIVSLAFTGRSRHGSAYGDQEFQAVVQEGRARKTLRGWYGLSVNAEGDRISIYETVTWSR